MKVQVIADKQNNLGVPFEIKVGQADLKSLVFDWNRLTGDLFPELERISIKNNSLVCSIHTIVDRGIDSLGICYLVDGEFVPVVDYDKGQASGSLLLDGETPALFSLFSGRGVLSPADRYYARYTFSPALLSYLANDPQVSEDVKRYLYLFRFSLSQISLFRIGKLDLLPEQDTLFSSYGCRQYQALLEPPKDLLTWQRLRIIEDIALGTLLCSLDYTYEMPEDAFISSYLAYLQEKILDEREQLQSCVG